MKHGDARPAVPATRFLELIDAFPTRRVVVVGDLIADEFIYGRIARVSREAPVLILRYDTTEVVPGGGANAANNVAALGGRVRLLGVAGQDQMLARLLRGFVKGVDHRKVLRLPGAATPTKTRILAGGVHSAKQQVVRIDREMPLTLDRAAEREFLARIDRAVADCDGVLLSDYGYGLITPELAERIRATVGRSKRGRAVPVLVDSRYELSRYRGLTACTPNESEVEHLLGIRINDDAAALERAGKSMLRRTGMQAVLVTRGSRGMALFEAGQPVRHIAIHGSDEIADVTGAGDTVIATMTLALAAGATMYEAARLANYAGGLVVMKRGTATVSADELRAAVRG